MTLNEAGFQLISKKQLRNEMGYYQDAFTVIGVSFAIAVCGAFIMLQVF